MPWLRLEPRDGLTDTGPGMHCTGVDTLDLECRDTIAALLTGSSDGALAVVRISGTHAEAVRDRCFARRRAGAWRAATLVLGSWVGEGGKPGGEALCATFPAGHSYTGEACVEIHGFGGRINAQRLLGVVLAAGTRQAAPGEFTLRAFLHGRLGLDQAEAVAALINAQTEVAAEHAEHARRGALARALEPLRERVVALLSETEAYLDFPDDGLPPPRVLAQQREAVSVGEELRLLLAGHARERRLVEGARVVLWGLPNVGKSTLLNALCGRERSIVDVAPGTTRDVVEVTVAWDGMPVTLVDTAGVRDALGRVEQEGVRRTRAEAARADLVLWCVAVDQPAARGETPPRDRPCVVVGTKVDRAGSFAAQRLGQPVGTDVALVSAPRGQGIKELRQLITGKLVGDQAQHEGAVAATARQAALLQDAEDALRSAVQARAENVPEDVVAERLRQAARAVGQVSGRDIPTEEVLGAIFSKFCVGK